MRTLSITALAACTLLGAELMAQVEATPVQKPDTAKAKKAQRKAARLIAPPQQRKAPSQEELKAKFEAKLGEAWLKNAAWTLDFDLARQEAQDKKKLIFAYFTRSYAP